MKFVEAYKIAMKKNEFFRKHDAMVKAKETRACLIFSIGDEAFAYGFDGVDVHKVKHTERRSAYLINRNETLVIE